MATAVDTVYKTLSFQYKPLEKILFDGLRKEGRPEMIDVFKKLPTIKKIRILDKMAIELGY